MSEEVPFCVTCPHCSDIILIEQLNCRIFRHGILKSSGNQMDPHAPKEICDELIEKHKIYGCGMPFEIIDGTAVKCEYK